MNWFITIFVFLISWWLFFIMALPFGIKRNEAPLPGQDCGAPKVTHLKQKAIIATILATITATIWGYFG